MSSREETYFRQSFVQRSTVLDPLFFYFNSAVDSEILTSCLLQLHHSKKRVKNMWTIKITLTHPSPQCPWSEPCLWWTYIWTPMTCTSNQDRPANLDNFVDARTFKPEKKWDNAMLEHSGLQNWAAFSYLRIQYKDEGKLDIKSLNFHLKNSWSRLRRHV